MPRLLRCLLLTACLLGIRSEAAETEWWKNLAPRDLAGAPIAAPGRWTVIVFISPECPVANASIPTLNALTTEFTPHGFGFVGVYADPAIDLATLRRHTEEYHLKFATTDDRTHKLVRAIGATYTPEVFVYANDGTLLYRGRIDDRVEELSAARPKATREDLREVLAALVAGQPGPFANRPGFGCAISEPVKQ